MRSEDDFDAFYTATSRRMVGQLFAMLGDLAEAAPMIVSLPSFDARTLVCCRAPALARHRSRAASPWSRAP
jgi:hypothetical protein